jgi:hypothetical protein
MVRQWLVNLSVGFPNTEAVLAIGRDRLEVMFTCTPT